MNFKKPKQKVIIHMVLMYDPLQLLEVQKQKVKKVY